LKTSSKPLIAEAIAKATVLPSRVANCRAKPPPAHRSKQLETVKAVDWCVLRLADMLVDSLNSAPQENRAKKIGVEQSYPIKKLKIYVEIKLTATL
jgi:hypothetical protein